LVELPYQTLLVRGEIRDRFLLDGDWLLDKLCGADVYQTLEDFAVGAGEDAEAAALGRCLEESAQALASDGRQLFAQLRMRLAQAPLDELPRLAALVSAPPPLASLLPLEAVAEAAEAEASSPVALLTRLPDQTRFVCSLATDSGELAVWDVCTGRRVRTLANVPQPSAVQLIDWRRCIVLCRRELTVFDLDQGVLLKRSYILPS